MAYHHIPCGECYYCRKQTFAQWRGLQEGRLHGWICSFGWRVCRVHSRDGLDRASWVGEDSG